MCIKMCIVINKYTRNEKMALTSCFGMRKATYHNGSHLLLFQK